MSKNEKNFKKRKITIDKLPQLGYNIQVAKSGEALYLV